MKGPLCRRYPLLCCVASWSAVLAATIGCSRADARVSDHELLQYPIIVVAKWDKAEIKRRVFERKVHKEYERFTELNVLRVIKGDLNPGSHALLIDPSLRWHKDGSCGEPTYRLGRPYWQIWDVAEPSLWFLKKKRSWDESDKTLYCYVPHKEAIQPVFLERFFTAIVSGTYEREFPALLGSDNPKVVARVLWFLRSVLTDKRERVPKSHAPAVRKVIGQQSGEVRALAVSVYAELKGKNGVDYMRSLLTDRDAEVRGIAIRSLARYRDEASIGAMAEAIQGVPVFTNMAITEALSAWGDPRLAPVLIASLEDDQVTASIGHDRIRMPSVEARKALHRITGHWFPYNVAASTRAWEKVRLAGDKETRRKMLMALLPGVEVPLTAEVIHAEQQGEEVMATLRVRNVHDETVTILRTPCVITACCSQYRPGVYEVHDKRQDFVSLRPSQAIEFKALLPGVDPLSHAGPHCPFSDTSEAEPVLRSLTLVYTKNGRQLGLTAWMGAVEVRLGAAWAEACKAKKSEDEPDED